MERADNGRTAGFWQLPDAALNAVQTWQGAFTRYLESCDANKFLHNWKLSYGVKREARYCLSQPPGLKLNEI